MIPATKPAPSRLLPPPWLRWAGFLLVVGYLLFSHGCHGDEDTELFGAFRSLIGR